MAITPFYTSDDLIEAVKRKISMPISQITFTPDNILEFANEEMAISQVPSVLLYHEEYFVYPVVVPLQNNVSKYPIPDRAIGMRLRDIMYQDVSNPPNLYELARIDASDKAFFQGNIGSANLLNKFYLENNSVCLVPQNISGVAVGSLVFYIFLRPNQLVQNSRAAILASREDAIQLIPQNFLANGTFVQVDPTNTITIPNHGLTDGNRVRFYTTDILPAGIKDGNLYYIINATTNTFQISISLAGPVTTFTTVGTGVHTVTRQKILTNTFLPSAVDFTVNTITLIDHDYEDNDAVLFTTTDELPSPLVKNTIYYIVNSTDDTIQLSNSIGGIPINITLIGTGQHTITSDITVLNFTTDIPANITAGSLVDFLQTNTGHRTYSYDVVVPINGVSGTSLLFPRSGIPSDFIDGDYICSANECIIPQIPSDLHNGLAERTCARILAALGDQNGLAASQAKIQEIDQRQGTLMDNRVEGAPRKVNARHSLLRFGKIGRSRRL